VFRTAASPFGLSIPEQPSGVSTSDPTARAGPQEQAVGSPADCLLGHVLVGGGDQERRKVKAGCLAGTSGPGSSSGRTIRVDRDGDGSVLLLG